MKNGWQPALSNEFADIIEFPRFLVVDRRQEFKISLVGKCDEDQVDLLELCEELICSDSQFTHRRSFSKLESMDADLPLGAISSAQINRARELLNLIKRHIPGIPGRSRKCKQKLESRVPSLESMSSAFFSLVPCTRPQVLYQLRNTIAAVAHYSEQVINNLECLEKATDLLARIEKQSSHRTLEIDRSTLLSRLDFSVSRISEKSKVYQNIREYYRESRAGEHFPLPNIRSIYRITRRQTTVFRGQKMKQFQRVLLWHGTNGWLIGSILSHGLQPYASFAHFHRSSNDHWRLTSVSTQNGGVWFAQSASTSHSYLKPSKNSTSGHLYLLLSEIVGNFKVLPILDNEEIFGLFFDSETCLPFIEMADIHILAEWGFIF